jgi:hypothetical protein
MVSVSTLSPCGPGKVRLNVGRHYPIRNQFGGIGVFKPADCDGMLFDNREAAIAYALQRGYLMRYLPIKH